MPETLQWYLKLREDVSAPAKRAASGLRSYEAQTRRTAAAETRREAEAARAQARQARQFESANAATRRMAMAARKEQLRVDQRAQQNVARLNARAAARDQAMQRAQQAAREAIARRSNAERERYEGNVVQNIARLNAGAWARDQATMAQQSRAVAVNAQRNAAAFREGQEAVQHSFHETLGHFATAGLAIGTIAAGIIASFGSIGFAAASAVVQVAAFRESSIASLTAVLGSGKAAGRQFRNAITVANQTPLDTPETIQAAQSLAVGGFNEREITPLLAAVTDVTAARGSVAGDALTRVLTQIRGVGRVNRGDIQMQAITAGLNAGDIYESIARQMNLGEGATGRAAAEAAVGHRQVNAGVATQAFLDSVRRRYDRGGALGSYARDQSNTLTGSLSNAANAGFNLLSGINFTKIPGVIAFRNAILSITTALDAGSPAGQRLQGVISSVANSVGGLFAHINPQSIAGAFVFVQSAFASIGRFATTYYPVVRSFVMGIGPGFLAGIAPLRGIFSTLLSGGGPSAATLVVLSQAARGLGTALGFVVGGMASFLGFIASVAGTVSAAATTLAGLAANVVFPIVHAFENVGGAMIDGIIAGITGNLHRVTDSVRNIGTSAVADLRAALGIHSPSRVFADQVGRQIPAGVEMGINANAHVVHDAVAGIAQPRAPSLGGLGGVTVYVNVTEARSATETAAAVVDDLEDQLGAIFGRLAEQHA